MKGKEDFRFIPKYSEEINYVLPILTNLPKIEVLKNDKKLLEIFKASKNFKVLK